MTAPAGIEEANAASGRWREVPAGWRPVSAVEAEDARTRVLNAIEAASTLDGIQRLGRALAPESRHPVRLLELWPSGDAFNAGDLLVIQLLGHAVTLETCLAVAGDDGAHVRTIARHRRAVPIDRGACIADADTLLAMDALWSALFEALRAGGSDPPDAEGAAHMLCARTSPRLFPVSVQIVEHVVTPRTPVVVHGNCTGTSMVTATSVGQSGTWWPPPRTMTVILGAG